MAEPLTGRVLAVDPGDVRIGLAISDPTATVARPLMILIHRSRPKDAEQIIRLAGEQGASLILVGVPLDLEGQAGPQARKALRLVDELRRTGDLPVVVRDESGTSQAAERGRKQDPMLDARAAAYLLQEFLDEQAGQA